MTEVLSKAKLKTLEAKHPVVMSKREKLLHWADLIAKSPIGPLYLLDGLENWNRDVLRHPRLFGISSDHLSWTPFGIAAADEKFREAGLASNTPAAAMEFFELTQGELHTFACYCGGVISNSEMAKRVRALAG